ncbi:MAG TPA: protoporphyrinogen oxidase [Kofleriaceae bacterium]|nr:protoporphyrinogen oxidase [Kofleriaceae bacterium]
MRIAVIGGGLGGLTAARALALAGFDAHVLEEGSRAGGVIGTSRPNGFVREHAASSFLGGVSRGALSLCEQLGVPVDKASPRARRRWIFIDGKLRALPQNPFELARSDLLTWRGKLDLLREPLRSARPVSDAGAEDESMHAFAARRFGAEAARAIVAPFVTGVYAADAHDISLAAGFPRLAALEAQGGIVRGFARQAARGLFDRAFAAIQGKRPPLRPPRGLYAPRGGLQALVDALAAALGPRLHLGHPVTRIEPAGAQVAIDGETWDGAVLALPAEDAVPLVALPELAARLAPFHRAPAAVVYLGYPASAVPRASDGFGFLVAQGEDVRVLGVVFESVVWPDRAPEGHVLLRCIFGGGRDPEAFDLDDAQLIAQAQRDVGRVLELSAAPVHTSVVRWRRGVAQYAVGHRDHVRAAVTAARTHRIVLAGADYRGPGVNDLCADADLVVDEVRAW